MADPGCAGRGVRRYRHLAALRHGPERPGRRRQHAAALCRLRRAVPHLLGADRGGLDQICRLHHARRQSWRGRRDGAGGAGTPIPRQPQGQDRHRHCRLARTGAVLWRRHAHARHLRAVGAGRHQCRQQQFRAFCRAFDPGDSDRAVPDPEPRHRDYRQAVRAGDGAVVHRAGCAGRCRHSQGAANPAGRQSDVWREPVPARALDRFCGAGFGGAGGDGLRGAVCRYGPFRGPRHSLGVALFRAARLAAELFRPGRAAVVAASHRQLPVLRHGAALGALPDGGVGRDGHHHRQPGGDQRRLFHHPPGGAAGPVAAHGNPPHFGDRGRADLCAPHQCHAVRWRGADRTDLQIFRRAGHRLWHRGDRRDGDFHRAGRHDRHLSLEVAAARRLCAVRRIGTGGRDLPGFQQPEGSGRRLAAFGGRRGGLCADGHLAGGTAAASGKDARQFIGAGSVPGPRRQIQPAHNGHRHLHEPAQRHCSQCHAAQSEALPCAA